MIKRVRTIVGAEPMGQNAASEKGPSWGPRIEGRGHRRRSTREATSLMI